MFGFLVQKLKYIWYTIYIYFEWLYWKFHEFQFPKSINRQTGVFQEINFNLFIFNKKYFLGDALVVSMEFDRETAMTGQFPNKIYWKAIFLIF